MVARRAFDAQRPPYLRVASTRHLQPKPQVFGLSLPLSISPPKLYDLLPPTHPFMPHPPCWRSYPNAYPTCSSTIAHTLLYSLLHSRLQSSLQSHGGCFRVPLKNLLSAPLVLSDTDFGIEQHGLDSLLVIATQLTLAPFEKEVTFHSLSRNCLFQGGSAGDCSRGEGADWDVAA